MAEQKKTILIVDDDQNIADLIASPLRDLGFEVTTVTDGYQAVNEAQANKPSLILLDVVMPKMDGFKVCRLIKFNEDLKNIPIIMMTSLSEAENRPTGEKVGADAYIPKPFKVDELLAKVKQLTAQSK
ncbi:MAG: response regulator [bacterium]